MKRSYYIVPIVALALFSAYYWQNSKAMEKKAEAQRIENARIQAEVDAKKQEAERKAREDADRRIAEREALEKKKEDEKEAKKQAELAKITADTDRYNAQLADYNKQVAAAEKQLKDLRAEKEKLGRESFDFAKKVELALIDKHNAEFQVQRMAEMVAKRASESTLTKMPAPPTTPAK